MFMAAGVCCFGKRRKNGLRKDIAPAEGFQASGEGRQEDAACFFCHADLA
jgi:hypothetical protein